MYIKDLKILEAGRSLSDVIIVDNNLQSFYLQMRNGIPIYEYNGDKTDDNLELLTDYLMEFQKVADVRRKIEKDFKIQVFM